MLITHLNSNNYNFHNFQHISQLNLKKNLKRGTENIYSWIPDISSKIDFDFNMYFCLPFFSNCQWLWAQVTFAMHLLWHHLIGCLLGIYTAMQQWLPTISFVYACVICRIGSEVSSSVAFSLILAFPSKTWRCRQAEIRGCCKAFHGKSLWCQYQAPLLPNWGKDIDFYSDSVLLLLVLIRLRLGATWSML